LPEIKMNKSLPIKKRAVEGGPQGETSLSTSPLRSASRLTDLGNLQVQGMRRASPSNLQAKLEVNQPGDAYEQEADQVAEQVMRMPEPQRASTVGRDIVFGAGRYAPGTEEGRRLPAHELTHTLQQQSAPQIQRKLSVDPNLP